MGVDEFASIKWSLKNLADRLEKYVAEEIQEDMEVLQARIKADSEAYSAQDLRRE